MIFKTPNRFFLTSGHAEGFSTLNAFDSALIDAGVGDLNLIRLSSILPPFCRRIDYTTFSPGSLVPVAYSEMKSNSKGEVINASVAIGVPLDNFSAGLIMEYSAKDKSKEYVEAMVKQMVTEGMRVRGREIYEILCISSQHIVENNGAVFAGVVMFDSANEITYQYTAFPVPYYTFGGDTIDSNMKL